MSFLDYAKQQKSWPGQAGVEVYPACYHGRFEYCGWQLLGGVADVAPFSVGNIQVNPTIVEHFNAQAIYIFGIDPLSPSTNLRFTIGNITIGGEPQTANDSVPDGVGQELLSDVFNRTDQPLMVDNWSIFSTPALGAPLILDVFNLNASILRVYISVWGNALTDEFVKFWQKNKDRGFDTVLTKIRPLDTYDSFAMTSVQAQTRKCVDEECLHGKKRSRRRKKKR